MSIYIYAIHRYIMTVHQCGVCSIYYKGKEGEKKRAGLWVCSYHCRQKLYNNNNNHATTTANNSHNNNNHNNINNNNNNTGMQVSTCPPPLPPFSRINIVCA